MTENESTDTAFTEDDLISLGKKLATLDLTEPERAALAELISDEDVGGFGRARFDIVGGIKLGYQAQVGGRHGFRDPSVNQLQADGIVGMATDMKPGRF